MTRGWSRFGRYSVLVVVAGIWFLGKFLRYAFPPLFEELKNVFVVSNTAVGTAFTGFLLVYALMQFPSGLLADRFGPVKVITAGVVTTALGAALVAVGGPFPILVVAMLVMGAGTGAHKTVAITLLALVYSGRTGRTLGIFDTLGTFGGVIAPVTIAGVLAFDIDWPLVGPIVEWRLIFLGGSLLGVVLGVGMVTQVPQYLPDRSEAVTTDRPSLRAYTKPFSEPRFLGFVVVTLGFSFAYNGIVAFLPVYLIEEVGTSSAIASLLYSALFVVSVVQILTGELADRLGRLSVITGTLALATCSLGLLLVTPLWERQVLGVPILGAIAVVGIGLGSHGFRPVRGVHLEALLPASLAGGGLGAVRTALMAAGAVAPAVVGVVADKTNFRVAFLVLFGPLLVAVSLAVGLWLTQSDSQN
jgi:MFS family permease